MFIKAIHQYIVKVEFFSQYFIFKVSNILFWNKCPLKPTSFIGSEPNAIAALDISLNLCKSVSDTYSQVNTLKTDILDRDGKIRTLEGKVEELKGVVQQKENLATNLESEMKVMKNAQQEKDMGSAGAQSKIELELKEKLFKAKGEAAKKIGELESKVLDGEIALQDYKTRTETAEKQYNDIKTRTEEMMEKFDSLNGQNETFQEMIQMKVSQIEELQEFYDRNINMVINMEGLTKLFEQEPLFKCFNLVREVGEMNIDDLKNALGIPSVTTNKYVQLFIKADLFGFADNGKITLKHILPRVFEH